MRPVATHRHFVFTTRYRTDPSLEPHRSPAGRRIRGAPRSAAAPALNRTASAGAAAGRTGPRRRRARPPPQDQRHLEPPRSDRRHSPVARPNRRSRRGLAPSAGPAAPGLAARCPPWNSSPPRPAWPRPTSRGLVHPPGRLGPTIAPETGPSRPGGPPGPPEIGRNPEEQQARAGRRVAGALSHRTPDYEARRHDEQGGGPGISRDPRAGRVHGRRTRTGRGPIVRGPNPAQTSRYPATKSQTAGNTVPRSRFFRTIAP